MVTRTDDDEVGTETLPNERRLVWISKEECELIEEAGGEAYVWLEFVGDVGMGIKVVGYYTLVEQE